MNKGLLIVVSGPSGCGKGTVLKNLIKVDKNICLSVSSTTRSPRENEVSGVDYNFVSKDTFKKLIEEDHILEYAIYCENYYGTSKKYIEENLNNGKNILLEIDTKGALQIKEKFEDALFIFIMPPSILELKNRLINRNTETDDIILKRLDVAKEEIKFSKEYDYIIVNHSIDDCVKTIQCVIESQRFKFNNMKKFIDEVLNNA